MDKVTQMRRTKHTAPLRGDEVQEAAPPKSNVSVVCTELRAALGAGELGDKSDLADGLEGALKTLTDAWSAVEAARHRKQQEAEERASKERADALSPAKLSFAAVAAAANDTSNVLVQPCTPNGEEAPPLAVTKETQYSVPSAGVSGPPEGGSDSSKDTGAPTVADAKMGGNENDRDKSGKRAAEQAALSSEEEEADPLSWETPSANDAESARDMVDSIQNASADKNARSWQTSYSQGVEIR